MPCFLDLYFCWWFFLRIRNPKVKAPRISPPPCGIILFGSLVPSALKRVAALRFVSHQWAGFDHPDPQFQQLSVLQQVLRQLLTTDMPINTNIMTRVVLGYNQCILPQEWREKPLLIWYDYFSIPQLEVRNPSVTARDLQNAVDSIPTYLKHLGRKKKRKTLKRPEMRISGP